MPRDGLNPAATHIGAPPRLAFHVSGVNEEGPPVPMPFIVDRPFFFLILIQDERTAALLFLGRVLIRLREASRPRGSPGVAMAVHAFILLGC